ncbi:MAG TPA: MG2 domain-containing protein, partial [Burkholderiales bacterium]|nr:MG2 domain-containing protein [Burkholderiales bacterium]
MKSFPLALLLTLALAPQLVCQVISQESRLEKAGKLFKAEHWAEARVAYDEARGLESDSHSALMRRAVEGAVACSVKLQLWDDALARATEFVEKTKGSFEEAVGRRFLGGLYLTFPHQGLKQGGKFLRGQSGQGVFVYSWKKDRKEAVLHYERARDLLVWLIAHPEDDRGRDAADRGKLLNAELIGVNFDLAAALAQQDSNRWSFGPWGLCGWWWPSWGEAEENSEAVEEADYEEPRHYRGWYGQEQETPTGIPLGADGQPRFPVTPKEYAADLGAGPKIRFLLEEIQRVDGSPAKEDAAKALFRWAMVARSLYGPETAQWGASRTTYDRFGRPQPQPKDPDEPKRKIWELADDEALTMAGGRVRVVTLPPGESPIALLRQVEEKYPASSTRIEAHYARALYLQTRQQFPQAVAEYEKLIAAHPQHERARAAQQHVQQIGLPGLILGASGVHLPGAETKLSFTYRNAEKIEFKAVRFDMVRYVQDKMEQKTESYWDYRDLHHSLFNKDDWKKYVGETVASWSQAVPREPENRAAEGSTIAPLTEPGAFVVEATTAGAEQPTRVLVLVTDIAIVQKAALKRGLIIVADARTGQPLADKAVRIYEHWNEYIQAKQQPELHVDSVTLTTNNDGVIEYARKHADHSSQVDAVVAGNRGRMAFSFFQRWSEHDRGNYWEEGPRYYAVTDRPVYRPGSTVKFRVWIRELRGRQFVEPRSGGDIRVEIYDAKNNEVQKLDLKADEMGAAS